MGFRVFLVSGYDTFSDYSVLLLKGFELPVGIILLSLPVIEFATMIILWQAAHRLVFRVGWFSFCCTRSHFFDIRHFSLFQSLHALTSEFLLSLVFFGFFSASSQVNRGVRKVRPPHFGG